MNEDEQAYIKAFDEAVQFKNDLKSQSLFNELKNNRERYRIIKLIGEGAAKKVYLAEDTMMKREVAYAEIKSDIPLLIEDFLKEARLTSTLEHPYIAPIHDVGVNESGKPFFIMKLYDGQTLDDYLKQKSENDPYTTIEQHLDIFLKVCEAISFAHTKKVLHLDIKPSNIRIDLHGEVLLCDWGIARLVYDEPLHGQIDHPESLVSEATMLGVIRGTPGYMAPEQKEKDAMCNERTDVFGLGALFHKMITKEVYNGSFDHLENFQPCPNDLKDICRKALAHNQEDRYNSAEQLIKDLHHYREGLVIQAETATFGTIMKKWIKRHKLIVTLSSSYFLILVAVVIYYFIQLNSEQEKLSLAVQNLETEKHEKHQTEIAQAKQYFELAFDAYNNATSRFNFRAGNIRLAIEMLNYSIQVIPDYPDALNLKAKLHLLNFELSKALDYFRKANNHDYLNTFKPYQDLSKEEMQVSQSLEFMKSAKALDDKRLLKHLIAQAIFFIYHEEHELRELAKGILSINNPHDTEITLTKDHLDVSHNKKLKSIYAVTLLNFRTVNLSNTNIGHQQLLYLKNTHLESLNLANTKITHLENLKDRIIQHLDLQNCPLEHFDNLNTINISTINISGVQANLSPILEHPTLKIIQCDPQQYSVLSKHNFKREVLVKLATPNH